MKMVVAEVEKTGVVGGDGEVGGRREGRSSSLIKGMLGAFLCYFVLLCCCLVRCYGTIFVMRTRRDDCGCDSVLSLRPGHIDPSDEQPLNCQMIAILSACLASI